MSERITKEIDQIRHGLPPRVVDIWHDEHPLDYARWERALATYNAGIADGDASLRQQLAAAREEIDRYEALLAEWASATDDCVPDRYTKCLYHQHDSHGNCLVVLTKQALAGDGGNDATGK